MKIGHSVVSRGKLPTRGRFWILLFSRTMGVLFYNNGPIVLEQWTIALPIVPLCYARTRDRCHTLLRNLDVINSSAVVMRLCCVCVSLTLRLRCVDVSFRVCFVQRLCCVCVSFNVCIALAFHYAFASLHVCFGQRLCCVSVSLRVCFVTRLFRSTFVLR